MATERLRVLLSMEAGQYKREAREASTLTSRIGSVATIAAGVIAAQLAGKAARAVKDFVGDSLRANSDLVESVNAVEGTFDDAAEAVLAVGQNSASSFGLAKSEFNSAAVSFAGFARQITEGGGDMDQTIETLIGRATDFASVQNLEVNEALSVFQSTLAGQSRPIRQYGLDLSDAAVKNHALAEGIWDGNGAMTEAEKVMGRYSLLLQETDRWAGDFARTSDDVANKQRILRAEIEDQKALLGEAFVPLQQSWLDIQRDMIPVLGELASATALWTGSISAAEKALRDAAAAGGGTVDGLDGAAAAIENLHFAGTIFGTFIRNSWIPDFLAAKTTAGEFEEGIHELIASGEIGEDVLREMKAQLPELAAELDLSAAKTQALADAIDLALVSALTDEEQAARDAFAALNDLEGATDDAADAQGGLADETEDATAALREQFDLLRAQLDPLFRLQDAATKAADAQQAVNEAAAEYGHGSQEHLDAIRDAARANLDLRDAAISVEEATRLTREEFVRQQVEMGLTRAQAELLAEDFARLDGFQFASKSIDITTNYREVHHRPTSRTGNTRVAGVRQHGGPVTGSEPYLVGERGPELFVPAQSGYVISNADMSRLVSGMSNTHNYNIPIQSTGNTNTDAQLVGAVASVLRRMETL
jgi:hypothetical protein